MIEHNRCDNCGAFVEDDNLCKQCQEIVDDAAVKSDAYQNQNIPEGK